MELAPGSKTLPFPNPSHYIKSAAEWLLSANESSSHKQKPLLPLLTDQGHTIFKWISTERSVVHWTKYHNWVKKWKQNLQWRILMCMAYTLQLFSPTLGQCVDYILHFCRASQGHVSWSILSNYSAWSVQPFTDHSIWGHYYNQPLLPTTLHFQIRQDNCFVWRKPKLESLKRPAIYCKVIQR